MTDKEFIGLVQQRGRLAGFEEAEKATLATLSALGERLTNSNDCLSLILSWTVFSALVQQ